ncbi:MAG: hypothetical protein ACI9S8_000737 [Chlamydiales bacterium]|jgi:hypothetical protein
MDNLKPFPAANQGIKGPFSIIVFPKKNKKNKSLASIDL